MREEDLAPFLLVVYLDERGEKDEREGEGKGIYRPEREQKKEGRWSHTFIADQWHLGRILVLSIGPHSPRMGQYPLLPIIILV